MPTEEVKRIATFWVNRIIYLVNRVNMAAIDQETEEIISEYQSMMSIQPESNIYSSFNKQFDKLAALIKSNFIFDTDRNKTYRILLPDLKRENYDEWLKLRNGLIDSANLLEDKFNLIVEKNIKAKISVEGITPIYDGIKQAIFFNEYQVDLEKDSKEHAFCDVLFNHMQKEQNMSWDVFWEMMEGAVEKAQGPEKSDRKMIYDTLNRVNKKIQNKFKNKNIIIAKWVKHNVVRKF